ncbi:hypothetical protein GA0061094_4131 [[Bacillus] enclensis]|uniref:Uncharacterized protein n=1 Tax=[Bacillus] enclensis TaxID=1402860 RepID=A0A1C4DSQ9_9BACI|nr:hypothetical protein GA0061094_4131 [[Bacillus] enclensis]
MKGMRNGPSITIKLIEAEPGGQVHWLVSPGEAMMLANLSIHYMLLKTSKLWHNKENNKNKCNDKESNSTSFSSRELRELKRSRKSLSENGL